MRGAIFAYHAQNCGGFDYGSNDHIAFEADLRAVHEAGLPIVSLLDIARALSSQSSSSLPERFVAFSCDDGTSLDWRDYEHPQFGRQRAFANILREHLVETGMSGANLLTAFVIACPNARMAIDSGCYNGVALSNDDWWPEAAAEGLLAIENHSFDHVHATLPKSLQGNGRSGDFSSIDHYALADVQIRHAAEIINGRLQGTGRRTQLFAYPYGHTNSYLTQEYLPTLQLEHGMLGAFTTQQSLVESTTPVYQIPRLVCGGAWRTPEGFATILQHVLRG